jgi:hypothetical protein
MSADDTGIKIHNMGVFDTDKYPNITQNEKFNYFRLNVQDTAKKLMSESLFLSPVAIFFMNNDEVKLMELSDYIIEGDMGEATSIIKYFVNTKKDPSIYGVTVVVMGTIFSDGNPQNKNPDNLQEAIMIDSQTIDDVKIIVIPITRLDDDTIKFDSMKELIMNPDNLIRYFHS